MENYYEILQVSSNASKEIIDKAFKTLAKKYHPDANPPDKKEWAEDQFKKINAAYEIISDEEKRKQYDEDLRKSIENETKQAEQRYQKLYKQHQQLVQELNNLKSRQTGENFVENKGQASRTQTNMKINSNTNIQNEFNRQVRQSVDKAYNDAYIQRMKDYGYKIHYKKPIKERFKDIVAFLLAIAVVCLVITVLWQISGFRNYVESNEIYQIFIEIFNK